MTLPQLEAKSAALEALRLSWEARVNRKVAGKVSDAHAHALRALTDSLRKTRDGRPSLLALNASPSYKAALARLGELWAWLAGRSEASSSGAVRDFREAALAEAMRLWWPLIPEAIRARRAPSPTRREAAEARAAAIHGYDPRRVLEGPVGSARRSLKAALELAARKSAAGRDAGDTLGAWEASTRSNLQRQARTLLVDSTEYLDGEAGRALVRPEFLA